MCMKINIYYGGRGVIDDPTLYVITKMADVFRELNVTVEQFNLYEQKNNITALAGSLKGADGIILASTVEWYGVGGFLMQLLDAFWLYGDKEKISEIYMMPVVMSTTYGERDGMTTLSSAWEILSGRPCEGLCGFIDDTATLEKNETYKALIEKKAEYLYRTINQKLSVLPSSNQAVKKRISMTKAPDLTPQESEQLSQYASDDNYVQKQKEDIQELTSLFRSRMSDTVATSDPDQYMDRFREKFRPREDIKASYSITVTDKPQIGTILLTISGGKLVCSMAKKDTECEVAMQMTKEVLDDIMVGRMTFQRTFMTGTIRMKGEFKLMRSLDQLFNFMDKEI